MTKSFTRLLGLAFLGSLLIPLVVVICSHLAAIPKDLSPGFLTNTTLLAVTIVIATAVFYLLLKRVESQIDASARESAEFLDTFPVRCADLALAVFASAALS
jgi:hypothetical protein